MYICQSTHIKKWTHTFLESGHTFLPNDTDFGKIEKSKKSNLGIYTYDHWISLIENCHFEIVHMKGKFFNMNDLQSALNFNTVNNVGEKIKWLDLKWLEIIKDNPFVMKYKSSSNLDEEPKTINLTRRNQVSLTSLRLKLLYKEQLKITSEKYCDLQDLIQYVPPAYSSYFVNLPHEKPKKAAKDLEFIPDELVD